MAIVIHVFRLVFDISDNEFIETLKHINFNPLGEIKLIDF
jgi:hypothetical protein